jgi:DNA invertase Pin-like site-specific DNA recombinase
MLIGYARVSKADGSQSLELQHDALRAAGVERPGRVDGLNQAHRLVECNRHRRDGQPSKGRVESFRELLQPSFEKI